MTTTYSAGDIQNYIAGITGGAGNAPTVDQQQQIANAMNQYGVSPEQVSAAMSQYNPVYAQSNVQQAYNNLEGSGSQFYSPTSATPVNPATNAVAQPVVTAPGGDNSIPTPQLSGIASPTGITSLNAQPLATATQPAVTQPADTQTPGITSLNAQPLATTSNLFTPIMRTAAIPGATTGNMTAADALNALASGNKTLATQDLKNAATTGANATLPGFTPQTLTPGVAQQSVINNVPIFAGTANATNIPALAANPSTDDIKTYVTNVMNNPNLTQFQKEDQILKAASLNSVSTAQLGNIFGAANVLNGLSDYNSTISNAFNGTLNNPNLDSFGKVATIAQAANQNDLTAQDIATATGKKTADVQALLDSYKTGIGTLAKNITAPGQTQTQITQNALGAEQKYGLTDSDYANALGMKTSDVSSFLQPARDVSTQLQAIAGNPSVSTDQVQSLLTKINSDPTLSNMYGAQAQKLQSVLPTLQFKDAYTAASSGTGSGPDILNNYQKMVDIASNNPALSQQFGPQISAINQALQMSGNGKYISTFETFTGLDKSIKDQAQNLPTTTVPSNYMDDNGNYVKGTQTVVQQPKGVTAVTDDSGNTTYEQQIKTPAGWDPNTPVYAKYDTNGQLTGFYSPSPVFPTDANGNMNGKAKYNAVWNADGTAAPTLNTSTGGAFTDVLNSIKPGLPIIAMGLTPALAPMLESAIGGALTSAGMTAGSAATTGLTSALSNGIIRGGITALGGGNFAKGFDTGALSSGLTAGLNDVLPSAGGLTKALAAPVGSAIANSAVNGTNLSQGLTNALESGGLNYGLNTLLPSALPDNIKSSVANNPQLTGIASTLLPKLLQNQTINQNDLFNVLSKFAKGST